MRIIIQRAVFIAALALGAIWNCLCLFGAISAAWQFSLIFVGFGSLFVLIPLLFPSLFRKRERSKYTADLETEEKVLAAASVAFLFTWVLTAAACLVYLRIS